MQSTADIFTKSMELLALKTEEIWNRHTSKRHSATKNNQCTTYSA